MHLRSGRFLAEATTDVASEATTQRSHTPLDAKDKVCPRYSSSDSDLSSMAGSEGMGFIPPTHTTNDKGKKPMNPFTAGLDFDQKLVYLYDNPHGAQIYGDPQGRRLVKTSEHPTRFQSAPWVNTQGDICIGEDGARYVVT